MYIKGTYMNIKGTYMYIYHAPRCVVLNACSSLLCVSHNTLCYNKHVSDIALNYSESVRPPRPELAIIGKTPMKLPLAKRSFDLDLDIWLGNRKEPNSQMHVQWFY